MISLNEKDAMKIDCKNKKLRFLIKYLLKIIEMMIIICWQPNDTQQKYRKDDLWLKTVEFWKGCLGV